MEPQPGPSREKEILSPIKKRRKTALTISEKTMVMNCYKYVSNNCPKDQYWTLSDFSSKVAEMLGIAEITVRRVVREHKNNKGFASPKKTGPKMTILDKIDEFDLAAIRRIVLKFFHRNEAPTIQKILQVVNDSPDLPNLSASSLRLILKKSCLIDRADILACKKIFTKNQTISPGRRNHIQSR